MQLSSATKAMWLLTAHQRQGGGSLGAMGGWGLREGDGASLSHSPKMVALSS